MTNMTWFTIMSTVAAVLAIAVGTMFPALAMGRAVSQALESLARQPEAERSIMRTLVPIIFASSKTVTPAASAVDANVERRS